MKRHDYRGDVLTMQVYVDRAHSATINGRRMQTEPGVDLRGAVLAMVSRHARRVGRALPMVVHESRAECTLRVHPDGTVEPLGVRGRQRAQRWLPADPSSAPSTSQASVRGEKSSASAEGRADGPDTSSLRLRIVKRREAAPAATPATSSPDLPSRRAPLPRYGARPDNSAGLPLMSGAASGAPTQASPQGYSDDTLRLVAERLGLTPQALAVALRSLEIAAVVVDSGSPARRVAVQDEGT